MLLYGFQPKESIQNIIGKSPLEEAPLPISEKNIQYLQKLRLVKLDLNQSDEVDCQIANWQLRVYKYEGRLKNHQYSVGDCVLYENYAISNSFGHP